MVRYILGFRWGSANARTLATTTDSIEAAHEERTRHADSSTMSGYPELYYDDGSGWKTATGADYAALCVKYEGRMIARDLEAIWNTHSHGEYSRWGLGNIPNP